jgi:hypothetical protein
LQNLSSTRSARIVKVDAFASPSLRQGLILSHRLDELEPEAETAGIRGQGYEPARPALEKTSRDRLEVESQYRVMREAERYAYLENQWRLSHACSHPAVFELLRAGMPHFPSFQLHPRELAILITPTEV